MWNSDLYNKALKQIKERGSFKGQFVKSKEEVYWLLSKELYVSYHAVKGWSRKESTGPGDKHVLEKLKSLLGTDMMDNEQDRIKEVTEVKAIYSDFIKNNIQKAYDLLLDYLYSDEIEDEDEYCKMRENLAKLQIAIPKEIYNKIEKCADEYLEPIIYDRENFFAELYSEELGHFDEKHVFHLRDEDAMLKYMGLFFKKIFNVRKCIEEFGIKELYPILIG